MCFVSSFHKGVVIGRMGESQQLIVVYCDGHRPSIWQVWAKISNICSSKGFQLLGNGLSLAMGYIARMTQIQQRGETDVGLVLVYVHSFGNLLNMVVAGFYGQK